MPDSASAWAVYAVLLPDTATRDRLQQSLREAGVPSAIYYPRALHQQPAYAAAHDGAVLPVSEDLATRIMALADPPGSERCGRRAGFATRSWRRWAEETPPAFPR